MIEILLKNDKGGYDKLELDKNSVFGSFVLSMKETDVNDPSAIFTNYSKSFTIPGTKHNKNLLKFINRLDVDITNKKRYECIISNNGLFIDRGYIRITDISSHDGYDEFTAMFYSQLCLLFNNLKTGIDGENRTMDSLIYGLTDEDKFAMYWNAENIKDNFDLYKSHINDYEKYITDYANFTIVPSYTGYYDDFDNDKVLCYHPYENANFTSELGEKMSGATYGDTLGWALFEMPRELGAMEVRDLRVKKQHIGIKNSMIINAICDPQNNGGYEIVLDDKFKEEGSKWYNALNKTWVVVDPVKPDDYENDSVVMDKIDIPLQIGPVSNPFTVQTGFFVHNGTVNVDVHTMKNKKIRIPAIPDITLDGETTQFKNYLYLNTAKTKNWRRGCICVKYTVVDQDFNTIAVERKLITTPFDTSMLVINGSRADNFNELLYKIAELGGITYPQEAREVIDTQYAAATIYRRVESTATYSANETWSQYIDFEIDDPNVTMVRIAYHITFIEWQDEAFSSTLSLYFQGDNLHPTPSYKYVLSDERSLNPNVGAVAYGSLASVSNVTIYDSDRKGGTNDKYDKKMMFANLKCTPLQYLLSFTKLLGLKFYYGLDEKIYIMTPETYYTNEIVDINDLVDKSAGIDVNLNYNDNKYYKFGYKKGDTYVEYLQNYENPNEDINSKKIVTDAEGSETKEVFDSLIWGNALTYIEKTPYYNSKSRTVHPLLSGTSVEVKAFKGEDLEEDTNNAIIKVFGEEDRMKNNDGYERLCFFDKEYKPVDNIISLQYLSGWQTPPADQPYDWIMTDDIPVCEQINKKECHIALPSTSGSSTEIFSDLYDTSLRYTVYHLKDMPLFLPVNTLDTTQPELNSTLFAYSQKELNRGKIDWSQYNYMYDLFNKKLAENTYNTEQRELKCSVLFKNVDNVNDLFRRYYSYQNQIWILNSVAELSLEHDKVLCKCTFLKKCA